ncbi:hypothetical protein D9613_006531 [Agrocybe pediades]|uniref:Protein kinase domain-containing protein n=1 Tax=Agrocybe pediades TaxID=84607 RepID=A0A8H4QG83_9AGAR|nr:hypothetical protein D9613_006531 [Agrocybe pediades]
MSEEHELPKRKRKAPYDPNNSETVRLEHAAEKKKQKITLGKSHPSSLASTSSSPAPPTRTQVSRKASVETVDDDESPTPPNTPPRNPSHILELSSELDEDEEPQLTSSKPRTQKKKAKPIVVETDDNIQIIDDPAGIPEQPEESDEAELKRLMKDWNAPIYAFFKPTPSIEYINDRRVHVFDDDTIAAADATKDVMLARGVLKKNPGQLKDGHLTEIFQQLGKGKGKVTYSHREHTKTERKAEIESEKAFNIFYNLPSLAPPTASELRDELDQYLSTDPENVKDALLWWHEKRHTFPKLSRMALDYLSVPVYHHAPTRPPATTNVMFSETCKLGQGASGTIKMAHHKFSGNVYAIKRVRHTREHQKGLEEHLSREISALSKLDHPGVIQLYEVYRSKKGFVSALVLEYFQAIDLAKYIDNNGRLAVSTSQCVSHQLCNALSYIHSRGLIHGDIKPENILISEYSEPPQVKICDFGSCQVVTSPPTAATNFCGTAFYAAPEALWPKVYKKYTSVADSWGLGVTIFKIHHIDLVFALNIEPSPPNYVIEVIIFCGVCS